MSLFTNKWLNPSCPDVNEFIVDNTKDKYYIQYYETKTMSSTLNKDWKFVKNKVDELKINIEEVKQAIDSEDYKAQTARVISAVDDSITALDDNFNKLFNSIVKRMEESAESDEWFSETASLYAAYIADAVLGKEYGNSNNTHTLAAKSNPVNQQYVADTAIEDNNNTLSGGSRGTNSTPSDNSSTPTSENYNLPTDADNLEVSNSENYSVPSMNSQEPVDELTATNVQYSASPSNGLIDTSKYHDKPESGFVVTTDNPKYDLSDSDIELLTAIVSAESDKSYDDALAVASTIFNRCESSKWASCGGSNPVKQATAKNQFVVYQHGSYKKYMGNGAPDTCRQAVLDVINGARNHDYLSFRSNGSTSYGGNMITSSGNRYK